MITKEQAVQVGNGFGRTEFHFGACKRTIGPRGGVTDTVEVWRSNGKCQTWTTRPTEFSLPIKQGYNGPCTYLTQYHAKMFHLASECPLLES
jgi:hypothetical protein